ncbi:hypothetical protein RRG08_030181 [Elysia crispata]|uniref:Uncharacterized protein n=1 Tax=Elysia crispata TaxID=231223 RepID=A0AAE0ZR77_9GAST|nr:hypothetical protein RRG08_030181 [Elysia crispata]
MRPNTTLEGQEGRCNRRRILFLYPGYRIDTNLDLAYTILWTNIVNKPESGLLQVSKYSMLSKDGVLQYPTSRGDNKSHSCELASDQ